MRSGRCPKCQATDIRVGPTGANRQVLMNRFSITWWRTTTPDRYVCTSCGYMEQYVGDPAGRRVVKEKWPIVTGGGTR